jgi:hypothetical protein
MGFFDASDDISVMIYIYKKKFLLLSVWLDDVEISSLEFCLW